MPGKSTIGGLCGGDAEEWNSPGADDAAGNDDEEEGTCAIRKVISSKRRFIHPTRVGGIVASSFEPPSSRGFRNRYFPTSTNFFPGSYQNKN